jgi:hypothetical protein
MAMTGDAMAAMVKTKIEALTDFPATGQSPVFADDRVLKAFCQGIVEYIQANAVVPSTGLVTSGPGSGGAVTATGTVT